MLLLITVSIIAIGMTLLLNIYSIFSPFINTLGDIKDYNIAYYGAIASVERGELILRYHKAGFEGSGGWNGNTSIGPTTDNKIPDFSMISKGDNGMWRKIQSRNNGTIPEKGKGNVDLELRGNTSKDYNKLDYNLAEELVLDTDITSNPTNYYTSNVEYQSFLGNEILGEIRLPEKIYPELGGLCTTCDDEGDGIGNDAILSRSMNGTANLAQYNCSANHVQVINGTCGTDNGTSLTSNPNNLCASGDPSPPPITDGGVGGKYSWKCIGRYGGTTVDCSANHIEKIDGECGSDNGKDLLNTPTNLCAIGSGSSVIDNGEGNTYSWTCFGKNGGKDKTCTANHLKVQNGSCGPNEGKKFVTLPTTGLCNSGTGTNVIDYGTGRSFERGCNGTPEGYGSDVSCSAFHVDVINGECGSANGTDLGRSPSSDELCIAGIGSTIIDNGVGSTYTWTCNGDFGGTNKNCSANHIATINGVCGEANGKSYTLKPEYTKLCASGTGTILVDNGKGNTYTWSCIGDARGSSMDCSAFHICPPGAIVKNDQCVGYGTLKFTNASDFIFEDSNKITIASSSLKLNSIVLGITWNPLDIGGGVILSNGNLTAALPYSKGARTTKGTNNGKYYWEITRDGGNYRCFHNGIGLVDESLNTGEAGGSMRGYYSIRYYNCSAGVTNGYDYTAMNHAETQTVNKDVNEKGGVRHYTATATCNNGNVSISNISSSKTCQTGYTNVGGICYENCPAGTFSGYNYNALVHSGTQAVSKTGSIVGGTQTRNTTLQCSDGNILMGNETTSIACSTGYTASGLICYQNCSAGIVNGYNCPSKNHGQSATVTKSLVIAGGNQNYTGTATCNNGTFNIGSETVSTTCNTNYTLSGSNCIANIKTFNCGTKPSNTDWNTVSNYMQTWDGNSWSPADSITTYNTTSSTTSCNYKCSALFHTEDGGTSCISNTKSVNCSGTMPTGPEYELGADTMNVTWNGTSRPAGNTWVYTIGIPGACQYKCANGYAWDNGTSTCM